MEILGTSTIKFKGVKYSLRKYVILILEMFSKLTQLLVWSMNTTLPQLITKHVKGFMGKNYENMICANVNKEKNSMNSTMSLCTIGCGCFISLAL